MKNGSKRQTILIIEDEEDIRALVRYNLIKANFDVLEAGSGEEGLKIIFRTIPDLILLDLMLPGMDGLEFARALKHDPKCSLIPIIMVTAKGREADIVKGLENADDYITKPFSPNILIARVKAVIKRKESKIPGEQDIINIHDLIINPQKFEILLKGTPINLTKTEFQILHFLARKPGWVFTRYQIVDRVKGDDYIVTERAIDVTIVSLRKKLGDSSDYIETVRGIGYRFKDK